MTLKEAQEVLSRITYKPRFQMELNEVEYERHDPFYELRFTAWVEDSTKDYSGVRKQMEGENVFFEHHTPPLRLIPVRFREVLYRHALKELTPDKFIFYVRHHIQRFEEHEMDEWFRYENRLVNDPHKEIL